MYNGLEWVDLINYQLNDETMLPSIIYYLSEELREKLEIENTFFTLYLNVYLDSYPSGFPSASIRSEYPGYRLDHNFIYGSMDYSSGYLFYNLTPDNPNAGQQMKMK